jgi:hypothetical protein
LKKPIFAAISVGKVVMLGVVDPIRILRKPCARAESSNSSRPQRINSRTAATRALDRRLFGVDISQPLELYQPPSPYRVSLESVKEGLEARSESSRRIASKSPLDTSFCFE